MSFVEPVDDAFEATEEEVVETVQRYIPEGKERIVVVGIGGAGNNSVERMIEAKLEKVEYIALNTDAQAIEMSSAPTKLVIGHKSNKGLGAGGDPENGRKAAETDSETLKELLDGSDMIFITAGMGGGTGSGAAPVVAEIARETGALSVAVVTKPFSFEGNTRKQNAENAIKELQGIVDTLIVIPNQRLLDIVDPSTSFQEALLTADEMLHQGVKSVSDLITIPGIINLDITDVRAVISEAGGDALIGIGEAETDDNQDRAEIAATKAISSPMLEGVSINGAKGVVMNISGSNLTMYEVSVAADIVSKAAGPQANFIFGTTIDNNLGNKLRVSVIAAGFKRNQQKKIITNNVSTMNTKKDNDILDIFTDGGDLNVPSPPKKKKSKLEKAPSYQPKQEKDSDVFFIEPDIKKETKKIEASLESDEPEKDDFDIDTSEYDIPAFLRNNK
ncbi:MAG: cell division protein FtsZ [Candidatus Zixiibacteriota bacterium]